MHTRWDGGVRVVGIGRITIGIHQVPTTFVGPLAVHKELHVDGVAVTDGYHRRRVKSCREGVEGADGSNR